MHFREVAVKHLKNPYMHLVRLWLNVKFDGDLTMYTKIISFHFECLVRSCHGHSPQTNCCVKMEQRL